MVNVVLLVLLAVVLWTAFLAPSVPAEPEPAKYVCPECGMEFSNEAELIQHYISVHTPQPTPTPADGNLMPNPGFEVDGDGDGVPDGWVKANMYVESDQVLTSSISWTSPHTGSRGARLTVTAPNPNALTYTAAVCGQHLYPNLPDPVVQAGKTYEVRCWFRSSTRAKMSVAFWDAGGAWIGAYNLLIVGGSGWTQSPWLAFQVPSNAGLVTVDVGLRNVDVAAGGSWVEMDDFELYASTAAVPPLAVFGDWTVSSAPNMTVAALGVGAVAVMFWFNNKRR